MAKNFSLNQCALFPAEVNPVLTAEFPMLAGVQSIDYYESILSPSISVQVKILDVDGTLTSRGVYGGEKLAIRIKADKDSVYYKKFGGNKNPRPTEPGKAQDEWDAKEKLATEKYMSWMNAAYDGAISTQAHLEGSRLDTSKDHVVSQATPEQDKIIENSLIRAIFTSL